MPDLTQPHLAPRHSHFRALALTAAVYLAAVLASATASCSHGVPHGAPAWAARLDGAAR